MHQLFTAQLDFSTIFDKNLAGLKIHQFWAEVFCMALEFIFITQIIADLWKVNTLKTSLEKKNSLNFAKLQYVNVTIPLPTKHLELLSASHLSPFSSVFDLSTVLSRIFSSEENSIKRALIIHNARFRLVLHCAATQSLPPCYSAALQVCSTVQPATKACSTVDHINTKTIYARVTLFRLQLRHILKQEKFYLGYLCRCTFIYLLFHFVITLFIHLFIEAV